MKVLKSLIAAFVFVIAASSCKKYLNVVPDNVATIDYAFRQRTNAERYLFTCYSYMPKHGDMSTNPAFMAGDELWFFYPYAISGYSLNVNSWEIARGNQSATSPLMSFWNGTNGAQNMFRGIRDCNIFLENINKVTDMDQFEKDQWSSEVKFLKAYYHWWLLRMYGPVPIVDTNLPIDAPQEQVQMERIPVDSCFKYICGTIDIAIPNLPDNISDPTNQMGRITKVIALAAKAEILTTAASPLFNGNTSYSNFKNKAGKAFFNQSVSQEKWVDAMNACKDAILAATANGNKLNRFNPAISLNLPIELQTVMDIRTAITDNFNAEVVWGNTNSMAGSIQTLAQPRTNAANAANFSFLSLASVPFNIVNMFYTKNGVPIDEDKTLNFSSRGSSTRTAVASEKYYIQPNYVSAAINFDREPRFYADLGFDGSILYGNGNVTVTALNYLQAKQGQYSGWAGGPSNYNITGYWPVKLVNYLNTLPTVTTYSYVAYAWPVYRLSNLYLLYSETLNEVNGPTAEAYNYIDQVRARAGLPTVATSWTTYSNNPSSYTTKDGFRKIVHRERLIELAFEGQRFWDLRRWKEAERTFQEAIQGWNISQSDLQAYYQPTTLFNKTFQLRDYFWPIAENDLLINKNLIQNPGW